MVRMINREHIPIVWLTLSGIVLFCLIFPLRPFVIVSAGERGVVLKLGKVQEEILGEGIHPIVPVITQVEPMSVRIQKTDIEESVGTKDLQVLSASVTLNWHISPDKVNQVYQTIGDHYEVVDNIIIPAIKQVLKATTPNRTAEETLKERDNLKQEIDQKIEERLSKYGIIVDDVALSNLSFSEAFTKSIEDKEIARQTAQTAKLEAEAAITKARGKAEAQKILIQSLKAKILQHQAIEKWDGKLPQVMSGNEAVPFVNLQPSQLSSSEP